MENIIKDCVEIVKDLVEHEYLYFDTAVEVKTSPHTYPFLAWGVCVSPDDELYVMDADQQWHRIEPFVGATPLIVSSLYQRLSLMRRQYAKAS